jgi:sugar/nucleoside kinase (ribokinase family)
VTPDHDYVVIGHVAIDVVAETGARKPGGTVLYSGLQAARLGRRTQVVTAGEPDELAVLLEPFAGELDFVIQPRPETTTFLTSGSGLERRQRRVAWAGELSDAGRIAAAIVHIAPIARETAAIRAADTSFVGITPQGLVRRWDEHGEPSHEQIHPPDLPPRYDALVLDELERTFCADTVAAAVRDGIPVAVTAADDGVEVLSADVPVTIPAREPAALVDDLGAGDVFAAAFFVALSEGATAVDAAHFGQAAAVIRLAGAGPAAVAERAAIERLLA